MSANDHPLFEFDLLLGEIQEEGQAGKAEDLRPGLLKPLHGVPSRSCPGLCL
jgi:hypothetical protein